MHSRGPTDPAGDSFGDLQSLMSTAWGEDEDAERRSTPKQALGDGLTIGAVQPAVERPLTAEEQLLEMIRRADPDLSEEQVEQAVQEGTSLLRQNNVTGSGVSVSAVVSLLARHQRELDVARRQGNPAPPTPTPADVVATRRLQLYLHDRIADCRRQIFESAEPPFKTQAEAAAWANEEFHRNSLAEPELEAIRALLRAIDPGPGSPMRVSGEGRYVLLGPPDEELPDRESDEQSRAASLAAHMGQAPTFVLAGRSENLGFLSDVQRRLSEQVGVSEWEITRLILLDIPPAVRRWRPRVPELDLLLGDNPPAWFSVEIRDRHLSYPEIRDLFAELVREGFLAPTTSSARQRAKLLRLLDFVDQRRLYCSPARRWSDVLAEWNEANPREQYSLRGIKKAYDDALRLVDRAKPAVRRGQSCANARRDGEQRPPTAQRKRGIADRRQPSPQPHPPGRHPIVDMNARAERALAGDAEAQEAEIALYERSLGHGPAEALRLQFANEREIDALATQTTTGKMSGAGAFEQARLLWPRVRNDEQLRELFGLIERDR